jgi:7-keto-8-aminopelargonate synthetase-like enzyme
MLRETVPLQGPLHGTTRDFRDPSGPDLLARTQAFEDWRRQRADHGYWPFSRALHDAPATETHITDAAGRSAAGVNFASQDYLSLATSETLKQAAIAAIQQFGVHSAGSSAVLGNTAISLALEAELAAFLKMEHVTLFPTGWAAGYGVTKGLIRPNDYVLLDALAHNCLMEGANAATRNVSLFRHLDHGHLRQLLARIRARDQDNAILVITEGLFSMDSDVPDITATRAACDEFGATLVVDVAHDLGAMGPGGTGMLGAQGCLGSVDLVMGSFSKTFGSNGGFVASRKLAVKQFLKVYSPPNTFSNALSPAQAATVRAALAVVRSGEGERLRQQLMANILALRSELQDRALSVLGAPSPIVPVLLGNEALTRCAARLLPERGVLANLVEFPAVPAGRARFRLQVMAGHSLDQARQAARGVAAAVANAQIETL